VELRVLDEADTLPGGDVLPGFTLAVAEVFVWRQPARGGYSSGLCLRRSDPERPSTTS